MSYFTGNADGTSWSMPGNWTDNVVPDNSYPGASYSAFIQNSSNVNLDLSSVTIDGLTVDSTSSLGLSGNSLQIGDPNFGTLGALNNAGNIDLASGTLTIDSSSGTPASFNNNSSNTGTINVDFGTLQINDGGNGVTTRLGGGGTIQLNYGTIYGESGDEQFAVAGTIQGWGTIQNLTLEPIAGQSLILDESPTTGNSGNLYIAPQTTLQTNGGSVTLLGATSYSPGYINISVDNLGTVNIGQNDTLTFQGDGTSFGEYGFGNDAAMNIYANGTLNLYNTATDGSSEEFFFGSLNSPGTINLSGGTISGQTGTEYFINYTGSTLQGNGTIASSVTFSNYANVIASGGTLTIGNPYDYDPGSQTLYGPGTYTVNDGANLQFGNMAPGTGIVTNDGNIVLNGTGQFQDSAGNDALSGFLTTNNGSLTLQNGASMALTQAFTNSGSLNVLATSTLDLTAGGFTNVAGGVLNGGSYLIGGTLLYNGSDITAIGASTSLTLDGTGSIVNTNGANHDALANSLATNNGTLTLQNGASLALTQAFTNNGNLNVLANSTLDLTAGGFTNTAGGTLTGGSYLIGGTLLYNGADIATIGTGTSLTLDNAGAILNTNGTSHDALASSLATNNGTFTLQNGASLALTRAFTNNGTLNVLANSTLDLTAGGFTNAAGGTLAGGAYTIGGTLLYNGRDIATIGTGTSLTLDNAGTIFNTGTSHDALAYSLATNNGALTLQNGAYLALNQAFTNNANLNILANSTLDLTNGAFGNVNSNGVLKGGSYDIGGTLLYNGQAITAIGHATSLTLDGNGAILNGSNQDQLANSLAWNHGTLTLQNGAYLALNQTFTNYGTLNIQADAQTASQLDLTNGTFGNVKADGTLQGGTYNIAGTLLYSGPDILTIGTHTNLTLDGSQGAGTIVNVADDSTVSGTLATNNGTLNLLNGAGIQAYGYGFTNNGTTNLVNESYIIADSIINSGSMTVDASSVLYTGGNYTQTAGTTQMDGELSAEEADIQGGTLDGTGLIGAMLLNEGGTVAPGDGAPGVLTASDFSQTSGDLLFYIQSASNYSLLDVYNTASFGGNIEFDFMNGFSPLANQIFTLILFGSESGEFGSYTIDNLPAGYTANLNYDQTDGDLQVSFAAAAPEPGSIALMLAGLGVIGFARRRFRR